MRTFVMGMVAVLLVANVATAALLTEDFSGGQGTWAMANGTWATGTVDAGHGVSWKLADFLAARAYKTIDASTQNKLTMTWETYINDATTGTQRCQVGFANNLAAADNAIIRLGTYNGVNNKWVMYVYGASGQTFLSSQAVTQGWHTMSMSVDYVTNKIDWSVDGIAQTQITANSLLKPNKVLIGSAYTNGTTGAPDTTAYVDNINVTPEPATLALLASGLFLVRRRRA